MEIHVLYREVSDQRGTDEVVGVFSTAEKAETAAKEFCRTSRHFVRAMDLDAAYEKARFPASGYQPAKRY